MTLYRLILLLFTFSSYCTTIIPIQEKPVKMGYWKYISEYRGGFHFNYFCPSAP